MASASLCPELQDCTHFTTGIGLLDTADLLVFVSPLTLLSVSAGSESWTDSEKSLFSAALETCGKEFSLIQKMVYL